MFINLHFHLSLSLIFFFKHHQHSTLTTQLTTPLWSAGAVVGLSLWLFVLGQREGKKPWKILPQILVQPLLL
jgi:hypothetical protein